MRQVFATALRGARSRVSAAATATKLERLPTVVPPTPKGSMTTKKVVATKPLTKSTDGRVGFYTSFTSSKGNVFYAADYGCVAWPIGSRRKTQPAGRNTARVTKAK